MDIALQLLERAYAARLKAGEYAPAALRAVEVAVFNNYRGSAAVARGWIQRAEKLLEGHSDCVEYGHLLRFRAHDALDSGGSLDEALEWAQRAFEIAEREGDRDLATVALQDQGCALVLMGRVEEGMALIDEAMVAVVAQEISARTVGRAYCNMMSICEQLADFGRASEWTDAATQWCGPYSRSVYPGFCTVHRAELMRVRGDWSGAEEQARRACNDHHGFAAFVAAGAFYELGEIQFRRGDDKKAEEAFQRAHELGRDPVPGLALLRLRQGRVESALKMVDRALDATAYALGRLRLLPAKVEIAIAAGDVENARAAAKETEELADRFGSPVFKGNACHCLGAVALADNRADDAVTLLREALKVWIESGLPYAAAQTRLLLARAYGATGDPDAAEMELASVRSTLERLGAPAHGGEIDA